ncbi:uncharacterized protein B0I36DRAFT_346373 [Microdochium trichocladiopsis]|uniref:SET domain-containing protein n=1 Tax=Microdochium trichocladiopsis TaxID=1682393 RepID=A0A9P8YG82_9PEZI|nr:uncharacterized protein B0I36DRAFT_346373 [Microdochium trichocladiopsis]KAH7038391.1 hypothetical protein B0I36DRAFT_346373 [Microdochium trichocladiopsis]
MASAPAVHAGLAVQQSTNKGRLVVATQAIPAQAVLMVDLPYALVPAPLSHEPPISFCCNHRCNRQASRAGLELQPRQENRDAAMQADNSRSGGPVTFISCPRQCAPEVLWCSRDCHAQDAARHNPECAWLRSSGARARAEQGEFEFELLWLLARTSIRRHCDSNIGSEPGENHNESVETGSAVTTSAGSSHFDRRGWDSVWDLEGSPGSFPVDEVAGWRDLTSTYLVDKIPGVECTAEQAIGLICRLETNSFGLYPGVTGDYPIKTHAGRGEYFGSGLYPTAAMFNHACCPNVSHRLDEHSRRIFTANREIKPGEECCISYFDLVEFRDAAVRRHEIRTKWTFGCDCQRCQDDANEGLPDFLTGLDIEND